jgi:Lar family restriction alleviation protein
MCDGFCCVDVDMDWFRWVHRRIDWKKDIFSLAARTWKILCGKVEMIMIKPCPFCGEKPEIREWLVEGYEQVKIMCMTDECHVQPSVFGDKKAMVEAWNQRNGE